MRLIHKKQAAYHFGLYAETVAMLLLRLKFYYIIARRHRNFAGEVDIIAGRGKVIAFIEVKARKTGMVGETVSSHQQQRIIQAAQFFLSRNSRFSNHHVRFDVIGIRPWCWPVHIQDAWRGW